MLGLRFKALVSSGCQTGNQMECWCDAQKRLQSCATKSLLKTMLASSVQNFLQHAFSGLRQHGKEERF